jgi:hypothetical protein
LSSATAPSSTVSRTPPRASTPVGQTGQSDVLRAQVELTHAIIEERTAALAIEAARADLNSLLSRTPDAPLGEPEAPAVHRIEMSLAALIERALSARPELAGQRALIDREHSGRRAGGARLVARLRGQRRPLHQLRPQ